MSTDDLSQAPTGEFDQTQSSRKSGTPQTVVGMQIDDFVLLRRLGKGGMAEVWLAEQKSLRRNVALKLLRSDFAEDANYIIRFQTEAKAAAGLNHSNIVQVYSVGSSNGIHFIAQEYVQGQTVKALLQKKGPLELPLALMIIRQVAAALSAAGERGIVHRDIKPENIMLTQKGEVKVADFGLAQLQGGERLQLTQEGVTMGTPLYMSPEQVSGKKLDQRSDIYSLGITCYHMLCGIPPFQGDNAVSVAVKHLHEKPIPIGTIRKDLPKAVCLIIEQMIAKQPEDRYSDASKIVADVRRIAKALRTGEEITDLSGPARIGNGRFPIRRPWWILIPLFLVAFAGSAALGWHDRIRVPQDSTNPFGDVPSYATAEDQFLHAMFKIDDEDAFKAVIMKFTDTNSKIWRIKAHEQLSLIYLKDPRRHEEARQQLRAMTSEDPRNMQLLAESRIGEAYLAATADSNLDAARRSLTTNRQEFDQHLAGSWKELELQLQRMLAAARAR